MLENWSEPLNDEWTRGLSPYVFNNTSAAPSDFGCLVVEGLSREQLEDGGSDFSRRAPGQLSFAQRLLMHATYAVKCGVPILVTTKSDFATLRVTARFNGSPFDLDTSRLLAPEELGYLLQSHCETKQVVPESGGVLYLTPIERRLAAEFVKAGIAYRPQVPIGPFVADFVVGSDLVVECDGAAWHDPERDAERDEAMSRLGYRTLRLTGRAITNDPEDCVARVNRALQNAPIRERIRESLTAAQEKAVDHWNGPALVVAPAGSGKTRVVVERIKYLVERGARPERICAVSLTNATVGNMKDRMPGYEDVTTTTLHGLGSRICREHFGNRPIVQDSRSPRVPTRMEILRPIAGDKVKNLRELVLAIEAYRGSYLVPDLAPCRMTVPDLKAVETFLDIHQKYEAALAAREVQDFASMILDAIKLLASDPLMRLTWSSKFDYWIVDEFQDLAPPAFALLRLLVSPARNLMAVGDDDQIIYGFAGAGPNVFTGLNAEWRDLTPLPLDINYRCPHDVVIRSGWLISRNRIRIPKEISPAKALTPEDHLTVFAGSNYAADALEFVKSRRASGYLYSDVALLFRARIAAAPVELALEREGIPFVSIARQSLIYNATGSWILSWLRVVNGNATTDDWRACFYRPSRMLSQKTVEWLLAEPEKRLKQASKSAADVPRANERQNDDLLRDALSPMWKVIEQARSVNSPAIQMKILGLDAVLDSEARESEQRAEEDKRNNRRSSGMDGASIAPQVVYSVVLAIAEMCVDYAEMDAWLKKAESDPDIHLEHREAHIEGDNRVHLSTIHQAKGREWPCVGVYGPEGLMPDQRAKTDPELEEERRVAYVSITRGREFVRFAASRQYVNELEAEMSGRTWADYRRAHRMPYPEVATPVASRPVVAASPAPSPQVTSSQRRPGLLLRAIEWLERLLKSE